VKPRNSIDHRFRNAMVKLGSPFFCWRQVLKFSFLPLLHVMHAGAAGRLVWGEATPQKDETGTHCFFTHDCGG
jgi:hypothetical protein